MNHREQLRPLAFDEQRALEELQKLHRDIQRARGDREVAETEFDTFVRGFRAPEQPQPMPPRPEPAPVVNRTSRPEPPTPSVGKEPPPPASRAISHETRPQPPPAVVRDLRPEPPSVQAPLPKPPRGPASPPEVEAATHTAAGQEEPVAAVPVATSPASEVTPASPRGRRGLHPAVGFSIAAILVAGLLWVIFGRGPTSDPVRDVPSGAAAPQSAPTSAAAAAAPDATPSAPTTPQAGVELELITRRPVWMRVIVDGRRAIERELPAGERIPLRAEQTIVIRAGDGGAVTVRRGGAETRIGEDGFPITRTFAAERRGDTPAGR